MVLVPRDEHVAQFGKVPGVRGEIQLVEEGQYGGRFQVAVDVVEARQKTAEEAGRRAGSRTAVRYADSFTVQRTGPEHSSTRRARRSRSSDRSAITRSMSLPRTSPKAVAEVAWSSNQSTHSE